MLCVLYSLKFYFILINVDDITLSEAPLRCQLPCFQQDLDMIYQWAADNNIRLNQASVIFDKNLFSLSLPSVA